MPKTILIAEDEFIVAAQLRGILTKLGYEVMKMVASGEEVLQQVEKHKPDLILMDIYLAGALNGIDTAAQIRAQFDIPIVYLTGYTEDVLLQEVKSTEPYGYLVKPVQERELGTTVEMAFYRHRLETKLKEERRLLRTLIDNLPSFIFIKDIESKFVLNNAAHLSVLGATTQAEIAGKTDFDIFPPELAGQYYHDEQQVIQTGQALINREETTIDPQGGRHWLLTTKVPLRDSHDQIVGLVGISHNITEHKQVEESLHHYTRRLQILHEIDRAILAARSVEAIAQVTLGHLCRLLPCHRTTMVIFDLKTGIARVLTAHVDDQTGLETDSMMPLSVFPIEILGQGQVHLVEDTMASDHPHQKFLTENSRSGLIVPILTQEELIGALNVEATTPAAFTVEHINIVNEVAVSLAVAIRQARLYEQVRQDAITKTELLQEVNHRVRNNLMAITIPSPNNLTKEEKSCILCETK